jgi:DNA topoisomerase-3
VQLVIAEKPSVARDLARVLGLRPQGTSFASGELVITWCIGHLVELEEPASYDARWKAWRMDTLPMVPSEFKLRAVPGTREQLKAVCELLRDDRFAAVINACDAGREGELIFRYVYQLAGSRIPIRRLWISSLTDEAIHRGFASLKPGAELDALADAARCRSEADWLVGLNATRAVTLRHRQGRESALFSIGRVQTPTLAIMVERERQIRAFVAEDYWLLKAKLSTATGASFSATFVLGKQSHFATRELAAAVCDRDRAHGRADDPQGPRVEHLRQTKLREPPPLLFDLTSLQRTANKRFGLSAKATLEAAQALYERHKVLTYPRTDARHLSADMMKEMDRVVSGVGKLKEYADFAARVLDHRPAPNKRVFDDSKVSDHHAIIPTGRSLDPKALAPDEQRVFDLVVRRFLGVFYPDAEFAHTEVVVGVGPEEPAASSPSATGDTAIAALPPCPDRYVGRGKVCLAAGWQEVAGFGDDALAGKAAKKGRGRQEGADESDEEAGSLPTLKEGEHLAASFAALARQTKPPPRHTEATLLATMESAGKLVDDEALRAAMKDSGLGTPATRAAIIETLLKRGFVVRQGRQLLPTPLGIALLDALPVPSLASPELTGSWEARLARIARREDSRAAFMADIAVYVREVVEAIRQAAPMAALPAEAPRESGKRGGRKTAGDEDNNRSSGERRAADPVGNRQSTVPAHPELGTASAPPRRSKRGSLIGDLRCPSCGQGHIIAGRRGWGCSRWREGCKFVVWFEEQGKRRSEADLRALVGQGA